MLGSASALHNTSKLMYMHDRGSGAAQGIWVPKAYSKNGALYA